METAAWNPQSDFAEYVGKCSFLLYAICEADDTAAAFIALTVWQQDGRAVVVGEEAMVHPDHRGAGLSSRAGWLAIQGLVALLSRLPLGEVRDYSDTLWRDLPDNLMPETAPEVAAVQRLSSTAHWDIPLLTPAGPLHLLAWSATPPVFDGPEDRNGRRNRDEAAFWLDRLPETPFVLIGNANLDPVDGEGRPDALNALIAATQDPQPRGAWQPPQTGANAVQKGDPALDTASFRDSGPGNLRVDYLLPSRSLKIVASGVLWPAPDDPLARSIVAASDHRLVWVDLELPAAASTR
jgi:hypothetical protein